MYSSDGIRVSLSVNHIKRFRSAQQLGALFKEGSPVLPAISATNDWRPRAALNNFPASFVCKRSGIMIKTCGQIDQTIFSLQLFIRNICRWLLGFYKTPCAVIHPPYNFDIWLRYRDFRHIRYLKSFVKTAATESFLNGMVKLFPSLTNPLAPFSLVDILLIFSVVFLHMHTPNVGPIVTVYTYSRLKCLLPAPCTQVLRIMRLHGGICISLISLGNMPTNFPYILEHNFPGCVISKFWLWPCLKVP